MATKNHVCEMSNGLVDVEVHIAPGKKAKEQAVQSIPQDRIHANFVMKSFMERFPLKHLALVVVEDMDFHPESLSRFKMMRQLLSSISIPEEYISNFFTTICYSQVQHLPFRRIPVKGVLGNE